MANFESLPLELVLPIVKTAAQRWDSQYDKDRLRALSTISPSFKFTATTLLYERISLASEEQACGLLAAKDERYVVKAITFRRESYSKQAPLSLATALRVVRACGELEELILGARGLYEGLMHAPNLKKLKMLKLCFVPPTINGDMSFPSLRTLKMPNLKDGRSPFAGTIQLLRAAPNELAELRLPVIEYGSDQSEDEFANEFQRFAKNLKALTISFDVIDSAPSSPLYELFSDCSSLRRLYITAPDLGLLRQLLSELPKSTLRLIDYISPREYFLESYRNSADDLHELLSLPQLKKLKRVRLDLMPGREGDEGDEWYDEAEGPPGDEDGRFVACVERWEAKGLNIDGAEAWGSMTMSERRGLGLI